jgi:CheY-like chemotaxis protein
MGLSNEAYPRFGKRVGREHPPRLLIVEDQSLLAEYMAEVAEQDGWQVEIAGTAKAFEQKFSATAPDALALDLALPDGDGVELLRRLSGANYKGAVFIISSQDENVLETCEHLAQQFGLWVTGRARKPVTATIFSELLGRSGLEARH